MEGGEGGREGWWREWCRVGRLWGKYYYKASANSCSAVGFIS